MLTAAMPHLPGTSAEMGTFTLDSRCPEAAILEGAVSVLNGSLGAGFVGTADLEELTKRNGVLVRAHAGTGGLLGAATARVLDQRTLHGVQERLRTAGVRIDLVGNLVGELKSAAVIPTARGRGIGSAMIAARLEFLRARRCAMVLCASWATDGQSSKGLLEAAGFQQVAVIPGYWSDEQLAAGYLCPSCGQECSCTAFVMVSRLEP